MHKIDPTLRFWPKVDQSGGPDMCWPWLAGRDKHEYGRFHDGVRWQVASRMAWMLVNGPIPDGYFICHHCDNPPCCNLAHLFLGTALDNAWDMHRKNRQPIRRGQPRFFKKLDWETVREVRRQYATGQTKAGIARNLSICWCSVHRMIRNETWHETDTT